jgi:hypothetical protein
MLGDRLIDAGEFSDNQRPDNSAPQTRRAVTEFECLCHCGSCLTLIEAAIWSTLDSIEFVPINAR